MKERKGARLPFPLWFVAVAVLALALSWFMQFRWYPDGIRLASARPANLATEIAPVSSVRVNEVMTANRTAWSGAGGLYADWVELTNAGSASVDITGWTITDRASRNVQFHFPEHVLGPGEMVLVYCSGDLKNQKGDTYQAPFKLSSTGDALMIYDAHGAIMESINIPALGANQVYAWDGQAGAFRVTDEYTPGLNNTRENHLILTEHDGLSESPIVISEILAWNKSTIADEDGDLSDYIKLTNTGGESVNLLGYALSDNPDHPQRSLLPDVTLEGGKSLVVFASGKDKVTPGGEVHLSFKLNAEGETVVLTDNTGLRVNAVTYELLRADQSYARLSDGSHQKTNPSPGK